MPVTLPPKRKKPTEAEIEAVISKGGKTMQESSRRPDDVKHINIRLTSEIIEQIDVLRAKRRRKPGSPKLGVSLHDWIVEAVLDRLEKGK